MTIINKRNNCDVHINELQPGDIFIDAKDEASVYMITDNPEGCCDINCVCLNNGITNLFGGRRMVIPVEAELIIK